MITTRSSFLFHSTLVRHDNSTIGSRKYLTMTLAALPPSTIKLIGSSQVITAVSSVIKELMENSLDSGASLIEIKLDKHGLEKIEVKDDGCGVGKSDAMMMCLSSYTSKISDFSDLDNLSSYGFRGEALSSLCNVAQVCVTTKTAEDEIAMCYTYDHNGQVICSKLSHIVKGTIVTVTDLFKNLPVRKQFISNSKRAADELKKVEKIVKSLAIIHPRLRVTLTHNKFLIWQKTSVSNLRQSVMQVVPLSIVKQLHQILQTTEQVRVEMLVPGRDCNVPSLSFSSFSDACFLFINNRPVRSKEIEKMIYSKLFDYFGVYVPTKKYPVSVISLSLSADCLDVNLEPDKSRVYLKNQDDILDIIRQCMHIYYGDHKKEIEEDNLPTTKPSKKRKVEDECLVLESKKPILLEDCMSVHSSQSEKSGEFVSQKSLHEEIKSQSLSEVSSEIPDSTDQLSESQACLSQQEDEMFEKCCLERDQKLKETAENKPSNSNEEFSEVETTTAVLGRSSPSVRSDFFIPRNKQTFLTKDQSECSRNDHISRFLIVNKNNDKIVDLQNRTADEERKHFLDSSENSDKSFSMTHEDRSDNLLPDNKVQNSDDDVIIHEQEKHVANSSCNVGISSPTLSQWSRGEVITSSGNTVKGSNILCNGPKPESPQTSQGFSNRSVSSQMGCKEMSAFTKFARTMRKKILEEHPDMSFTRVAQQLQVEWRRLHEKDKKKYEETTTVKKIPSPSRTIARQKCLPAVLNKTPDIELEVDMNNLKEMAKCTVMDKDDELQLIGQLEASSLWLYYKRGSGITVVSIPRLLEAVRFHKHLSTFALPTKLLDPFIKISQSDLGNIKWNLLLELERSLNGVITDNRLVSNGFYVEINEGQPEARLTYVPLNVSYCGVEELDEILGLMHCHGHQASLSQCRPLKVISFIRSEVMRECSQEELPTLPDKVTELLSYWLNHVATESQSCIHYQPVTQSLDTT